MHVPARLKRRPRIPFFRIFYSTTFTALSFLLGALILITPGEHFYQSFRAREIYHIFIIVGFFLLTLIVAVLLYGWRLYQTRSALAGIPREWNITEGKAMGMNLGKVGRLIQQGLERSARIAFESRPRDLREGAITQPGPQAQKVDPEKRSQGSGRSLRPVWGTISHPGWSSPSSPDLPNVHYEPVILELPNLIEAKAVSLAPTDPLYSREADSILEEPPPPDPLIVAALQRPASMGLREYIAQLTSLDMIDPAELGGEFITIYEQARFSREELNEIEFRGLMSVFAEILRNMLPMSSTLLDELHAEAGYEIGSEGSEAINADGASFITNDTVEHTPQHDVWTTARPDVWTSDSESSKSLNSNQGIIHTPSLRPGTAREISNLSKVTKSKSLRGLRNPSTRSLRAVRSNASSSGHSGTSVAGSVIRLAEARTSLDLPYEIIARGEGA